VNLRQKQWKSKELGHAPWFTTLWGAGVCWSFGMGTRNSDKHQLLTWTCTNQTSWLVHNWSTLVHRQATGKHGLTRLTTTWTWGKPPPSPLWYTMCLTMGLTPKCHFVPGLPSANPKISTIGTCITLGPITLRVDLRWRWGMKKNCSSHW
jgi:hypothetical protein